MRVRRGKNFVYRLPNGRVLSHAGQLTRIRKLALPPAWQNVWICFDPDGYLQATGIDARGRKQYRYNAQWRSVRDEAKFDELASFAEVLPRLRRRLSHDLALPKLSRDKVLATVISVMAHTALRVGNERYVEENGSFGLTTLLDRHARIGATSVEFSFRGKGGKPYRARIRDRRLAAIVKRCRDIPGQRLFQYVDERGEYQAVGSSDVNEYLKRVTGMPITAKTFRTWTATVLALCCLRKCADSAGQSERAAKRQVNSMLREVSEHLGNTPAICRKTYVDPRVTQAYTSGTLQRCLTATERRAGLNAAECAVVALFEALRREASRRERRAA